MNVKLQGVKLRLSKKWVKTNKSNKENGQFSKEQSNVGACRAVKECFEFIEIFGKPIGLSVEYEWRSSPRFCFAITYLAFTWSQFWYSQYSYFKNEEYMRIFKVFAVYGVASSVNFDRRAEKLENQQIRNLKLYKLLSLSASLSAVIYIFYPIKAFVFDRELTSLLPIEILFTDQSTPSGFLIANTFMLGMDIYALIGSIYVDMIEMDVNDLNQYWRDTTTTSMSISSRHMFLRNICRKCQDMNRYMIEVKKIYDQKIFFFFCFAYVSQIICLYEIKAESWMSGYGIAFGLFLEMMFYCIVGTRTTIENERMCFIFTQSNWYTYDIYSQRMSLLLLDSCMNTKELSIGPLAKLNVYSGTEIIKSIYTYYTILAEVM